MGIEPTPNAGKPLILLVDRSRAASSSVQNRCYFLDCHSVSIAHDVTIDFERRTRVSTTKLPMDDFGRRS